jgi:septal ring factor EnvC (AmiA/AmiB activator)
MAMEDDAVSLHHLSLEDRLLRTSSLQHMHTFGRFQTRLQTSNELFTEKQRVLAALETEIVALEKRNKELVAKAAECAASARTLRARFAGQPLQLERERLMRANEKYRGLIETFQAEIDALTAGR